MSEHPNLVLGGGVPRPNCGSPSHSHAVSLQNRRDWADSRRIVDRETKIMVALTITAGSANPAARAHGKSTLMASYIYDVRKHGTGAGKRTRSPTRKKHLPNGIASDQHGIILVVNSGQLM